MRKTEIVKNCLGYYVQIEDFEGDTNSGWLVPSLYHKGYYAIYPLNNSDPIINYRPSHFKHLWVIKKAVKGITTNPALKMF